MCLLWLSFDQEVQLKFKGEDEQEGRQWRGMIHKTCSESIFRFASVSQLIFKLKQIKEIITGDRGLVPDFNQHRFLWFCFSVYSKNTPTVFHPMSLSWSEKILRRSLYFSILSFTNMMNPEIWVCGCRSGLQTLTLFRLLKTKSVHFAALLDTLILHTEMHILC